MTVVHDLKTYFCGAALSCGTACFTGTADQMTCAAACAAGLSPTSGAKFQALVGCIFAACSVDGGDVTIECAAPKIMQGGACFAQAGACQSDK